MREKAQGTPTPDPHHPAPSAEANFCPLRLASHHSVFGTPHRVLLPLVAVLESGAPPPSPPGLCDYLGFRRPPSPSICGPARARREGVSGDRKPGARGGGTRGSMSEGLGHGSTGRAQPEVDLPMKPGLGGSPTTTRKPIWFVAPGPSITSELKKRLCFLTRYLISEDT